MFKGNILLALILAFDLQNLGLLGVGTATRHSAGGGGSPMTFVQGDCTSGNLFAGTNSYVYTYPGAITSGNLVVIGFASGDSRNLTSAAGAATTYTSNQTDFALGRLFQAYAIAGGADTTVTITLSGNEGNSFTFCFGEFSNAAASQAGADHDGNAQGPVTAHASNSVTPAVANNVVVNYIVHTGGDWTYDADFTRIDAAGSGVSGAMMYRIQSATTAQEANHSSTDNEFSGQRISAFSGT